MSPTLFNIYIMDLEEEMRKKQTGGVVMGRMKICTISYADNVVLLADREEDLKAIIIRFKQYLEKKVLSLNATKSKVIVFKKGRGRVERKEKRE